MFEVLMDKRLFIEKPTIFEIGIIEYLLSFLIVTIKCVLSSLIVGLFSMILLHYAGMRGNIMAFLATLPSVPLVYFLLVQPALDEISRKRGEPLFRIRCKLFGHNFIMGPGPLCLVWCSWCGEMKPHWP